MLQSTFIHAPGITSAKEQKLWGQDILNWDEFLNNASQLGFSSKAQQHIEQSITAHKKKNYDFFSLPSNEQWRLYKDMPCCFLDIETTGLSKQWHKITTIGLYNGKESKVFIQGKNLDKFEKEIKKYPLVVTFNGKCFDFPFLKAKMPTLNLDKFHIDLRYIMANLGYRGGLKKVEKDLGIQRDDDLQEVDGYEAVRLWKRYEKGDNAALDLLIKYNIADIENLKVMMDMAFDTLKDKRFFPFLAR